MSIRSKTVAPTTRHSVYLVIFLSFSLHVFAQQTLEPDQRPSGGTPTAHGGYAHVPAHIQPAAANAGSLMIAPAVKMETVPTFTGGYFAHGFSASNALQTHWAYQMVGAAPES